MNLEALKSPSFTFPHAMMLSMRSATGDEPDVSNHGLRVEDAQGRVCLAPNHRPVYRRPVYRVSGG